MPAQEQCVESALKINVHLQFVTSLMKRSEVNDPNSNCQAGVIYGAELLVETGRSCN